MQAYVQMCFTRHDRVCNNGCCLHIWYSSHLQECSSVHELMHAWCRRIMIAFFISG